MKKNRDSHSEAQLALAGTEEGEILARLGERVEKAVATIQELRRERDQLRSRLEAVEAQLKEQEDAAARLGTIEQEQERHRRERSEIRDRIESILDSLEALEETAG